MDTLLKLPVATSLQDIRKIRNIYDKIESCVRGLQTMGIKSDSYGNLLIPIMFSKLPEELRLFISRKFDQDTLDIHKLLKEFKADLEARERVSLLNPRPENKFQANGQSSAGIVRPKIPTARALLSLFDHLSNVQRRKRKVKAGS